MLIRIIIISCFVLSSYYSSAQKNVDGIFIFKTHLFIEHENVTGSGLEDFALKDQSLFEAFINGLILKPDTIKSSGFTSDFVFLALNFNGSDTLSLFDDRKYKSIDHKKDIKYLQHISIPVNCNGYTLAINKKTGRSFRLQGFTGNDLSALIVEVKKSQSPLNNLSSIRSILKRLSINGIDILCLYKANKSRKNKNYKCTQVCTDFTITLH